MSIHPGSDIHPSAIVEEGATIAEGASVGAYSVIGPEVVIGAGSILMNHVSIAGITHLGENCRVFPFASLGQPPQDLKYAGERTQLLIGSGNVIREHVTMNPGTDGGGGLTRVGDGGLFMNFVHIGHDCIVGDRVIFANAVTLGGHVRVGDGAVLGGLAAVHQNCRIGDGAMIGGLTGVAADVIPYGTVIGERGKLMGLNLVGLKRRGVAKDQINGLRSAFAALFDGEGTLGERADAVTESHGNNPLVQEVLGFIAEGSARNLVTPE
ncbi:MAG: acyl-ACP--UDP-N-acetylglucosamine O-acyltransferase [Pseudomonadota bacterium]